MLQTNPASNLQLKRTSRKQIQSCAKVSIHMNTLIAKKGSKKHNYHPKKHSTLSYLKQQSAEKITTIPSKYETHSTVKHLVIIIMCT